MQGWQRCARVGGPVPPRRCDPSRSPCSSNAGVSEDAKALFMPAAFYDSRAERRKQRGPVSDSRHRCPGRYRKPANQAFFPAIWSEKEERGHSRGEAEASGGCGGELQCVARRRVCLYWRQNQRLPTLSVCSKPPPDVRDGASLDLEPVGGDPSRRASRASDLTQGKPQFFS
jgi:hypothetical protein